MVAETQVSEAVGAPPIVLFLGGVDGHAEDVSSAGFTAQVESDVEAGLEALAAEREGIDCVVVVGDGPERSTELVAEARTVAPHLPLLFVGSGNDAVVTPVLDAGANDVVAVEDWTDHLELLEHRIRRLVPHDGAAGDWDLTRYKRIVETVDDGIYTLDDSFQITWVNQAAVSMLGYPREDLIGAHASLLTSDETLEEAARITQELLAGEREVGRLDTELERADGERLPIETQFTLLPLDDDDRVGQVGVFRDITERKEYERVLTALHDSTRTLFRAETAADIGRVVQETAGELLDLTTEVYWFDASENVLRPMSGSGPGDSRPVSPGDGSPAWQAFVEESTTAAETAATPAGTEETRYLPLGEHGVLAAGLESEGPLEAKTNRLIGLLAATTEAALDRIDREESLRERDRELERQNRLLKQLNRVNEVIREIDQLLVKAETREEIQEAVCDRLARDERCAFVWIGSSASGGGRIVPRAWAGPENGYLDEVTITADAAEPTARAADQRDTVVVSNVAAGVHDERWRKRALSHDFQSVVSVPLTYGDLSYGVLTTYATEPDAFDETYAAVLGELGATIAYAINGVETRASLLSDTSIELDLRFTDADDLLVRMARTAGRELEFHDFVPQSEGQTIAVFTAAEGGPEDVIALEDNLVAVSRVSHVADRDAAVYEATIDAPALATTLRETGAVTRTIVATQDEARAVIELPRNTDVREYVETLRRSYPGAELIARRNSTRSHEPQDALLSDLESELTDRQLEVFQMAYRNGYFEWPREQTGEQVAERLGISQPTFNRHLRESERKLVSLLFEAES